MIADDSFLKESIKKILKFIFLIIFLILSASISFMIIEDWSFFKALWFTVVTISTVGYGDITPQTDLGRIFDILLIVSAISLFAYSASSIAALLIEGNISNYIRYKRLKKMIETLKDHVIICGLGKTGRIVARELKMAGIPFVAIDKDENTLEKAKEHIPGILAILGDATEDSVLNFAGIRKAKFVVITTQSDADNIFMIATAKTLNPKVKIIARASDEQAALKMKRVGATEVVPQDVIGATRMAAYIIHPAVVNFLDLLQHAGDFALNLEEVVVPEDSHFCGKLLKEIRIPNKTGAIVIGIKRKDGEFIISPTSSQMILPGDILIVLGKKDNIEKLKVYVKENSKSENKEDDSYCRR